MPAPRATLRCRVVEGPQIRKSLTSSVLSPVDGGVPPCCHGGQGVGQPKMRCGWGVARASCGASWGGGREEGWRGRSGELAPHPSRSLVTQPGGRRSRSNLSICQRRLGQIRCSDERRLCRTVLKVRLPCASEVKLPSVQISVAVATSGDNRVNALSGANHLRRPSVHRTIAV